MPKARVLAVDDNSINLLLVSHSLAGESDFEVVTCARGEDVLKRLNQGEQFDVLLVDWMMPEMSGYELVCAIRSDAQYDGLRIMMLTAKTEMEDVKQALGAGAGEYLMKPFTKEMLLDKLALLLLH
jgi:two-component system, chemotaxis family, chemotaxis protein CheY